MPCSGGEGAPNLVETLQNLAINGAAVAVLGFIFQRDLKGSQSDRRIVEREESLARLQVICLQNGTAVPHFARQ